MLSRRNAFAAKPEPRELPRKAAKPAADRLKPSVPREVAEVAAHLSENPVFADLWDLLKREALDRLTNSPLGAAGAEERETARYQLEALSTIGNRLAALGAELSLHPPADDLSRD